MASDFYASKCRNPRNGYSSVFIFSAKYRAMSLSWGNASSNTSVATSLSIESGLCGSFKEFKQRCFSSLNPGHPFTRVFAIVRDQIPNLRSDSRFPNPNNFSRSFSSCIPLSTRIAQLSMRNSGLLESRPYFAMASSPWWSSQPPRRASSAAIRVAGFNELLAVWISSSPKSS